MVPVPSAHQELHHLLMDHPAQAVEPMKYFSQENVPANKDTLTMQLEFAPFVLQSLTVSSSMESAQSAPTIWSTMATEDADVQEEKFSRELFVLVNAKPINLLTQMEIVTLVETIKSFLMDNAFVCLDML